MPCKAPNKPIIFLRAARAFLTTFPFLMVFLNVPRVFSSVLGAFKVVLDGSRYVCGGSKAVLVSKVPLLF